MLVILVVCAAVIVGASAAFSNARGAAAPVRVVSVDRGLIQPYSRVTGTALSRTEVPIAAPFSGMARRVSVEVGQTVRAGALLLGIDANEAGERINAARASLQEAETEIAQGQRNLKAVRAVWQAGGEPRKAVDDAEAAVAIATAKRDKLAADLNAARIAFGQHRIVSPSTGVVSALDVQEGQFVPVGTRLLKITSTQNLEILAKVDQGDAGLIKPNMPAEVLVDSAASGALAERVLRIDPAIQKEGNASFLSVWISARSAAPLLYPNQQVDVKIITASRPQAVRLPLEALVARDDGHFAWQVRDGRVRLTPIKTGLQDVRFVEVLSGLSQGDGVAVAEGKSLTEGQSVVESATP